MCSLSSERSVAERSYDREQQCGPTDDHDPRPLTETRDSTATDGRHDSASGGGGRRAVSPVVGTLVLIALVVLLATIVAVGASTWSLESGGPTAAFDLSVDGDRSAVTIEHEGGEPIDVERLSVTISVEGEELAEQPPVPFVGAPGFDGSPDGPFNSAADSTWQAGDRVGLVVAGTNAPGIDAGDTVTVTLAVDGNRVATLETTAA